MSSERMQNDNGIVPLSQAVRDLVTCPISMEIMADPVILPCGETYDRSAIEKWVLEKGTCPTTRKRITLLSLVPNKAMKEYIQRNAGNHLKKQLDEKEKLNYTIKTKPMQQNSNYTPNWIQLGSTYTSQFVNRTTIVIDNTNTRIIHNSIPYLSLDIDSLPVLPVTYDFPLCHCPTMRPCFIKGYNTMMRINRWVEFRNFVVNESRGFMFSNCELIKDITDAICDDCHDHSGTSMALTLRHLHCISKYGIEQYENKLN